MDHLRALALAVLAMLEQDKDKRCPAQNAADGALFASRLERQYAADFAPEKRIPEVGFKTDRLFMFSEHLSMRIAALESKLGPVLRSVPPANAKAEGSVSATPLGSQLGEIEIRLELMIGALDSIADRLEV